MSWNIIVNGRYFPTTYSPSLMSKSKGSEKFNATITISANTNKPSNPNNIEPYGSLHFVYVRMKYNQKNMLATHTTWNTIEVPKNTALLFWKKQ